MDSEFCEIDFTTATSWENFTAHLEEIFYSWKLYQSGEEISTDVAGVTFACEFGTWLIKCEKIVFDGKTFELIYYRRISSQNKDNDTKKDGEVASDKNEIDVIHNYFPLVINCLSKNLSTFGISEKIKKLIHLYDLQNFVVFVPTVDSIDVISSESYVKFLMSSFCLSAFNTRCFIPIFAQVYQSWQNCFIGIRIDDDGFRIDYQMIHLGKVPPKFHHFSGLLDLFKSKIVPSSFSDVIWASIKLSYSITNFVIFAYPPIKQQNASVDGTTVDGFNISFEFPFGPVCEPISEIRLHVAWPKVYENMVMDNENHSDFDPFSAPNWSLEVFSKNTNHLSSQHLTKFLKVCQLTTPVSELIGDLLKRKHFNASDLNVPGNLSISKIITGNASVSNNGTSNEMKRTKRFLPEEALISMLYYLFPDADQDNMNPYVTDSPEDSAKDLPLKGMKTCAVDELPWRLSLIMCKIIQQYGEHAAAQFWYEFIEELRFRWEKSLRLLGVQKGNPNHKTSLINQKLQMLNCCIQKRMKRERVNFLADDSDNQTSCSNSGKIESEDEEFYDCQTESRDCKKEFDFNVARVSLWNRPEGRSRKFDDLRLIETGDYMYIPVTQEPPPKTEDQLEDDAIVLMKLGADAEGSKLRARMMSPSLYSDMESFKAANPGAVLEDFIRWYSPRDWIESDELDEYGQKKGKLSHRMLLPGNMWKEVWDTSIPVPACRQKCLFDDRKESEKVLHFFESQKHIADVFKLLLPTLLHVAMYRIINDKNIISLRRYSSSLDEKITVLSQKAVSATRNITLDISQFEAIAVEIGEIENIVSRYKSLEMKLFPLDLSQEEKERNTLMKLVLGDGRIILSNAPVSRLGKRIIFLFSKEKDEILLSTDMEKEENIFDHAANELLRTMDTTTKPSIPSQPDNSGDTISKKPYQKEFILHVTSSLPYSSSRSGSHKLTAHVCNEEILMASYFTRDCIFV